MKIAISLLLIGANALLGACQSTSQQFNGKTGFEIEQKNASSATIKYTLASTRNIGLENRKLQHACEQALGLQKTYQINILDSYETAAPQVSDTQAHMALGKTGTNFSFSNTPDLNHNSEAYAARQIEEVRPNMLKVVRYTCS